MFLARITISKAGIVFEQAEQNPVEPNSLLKEGDRKLRNVKKMMSKILGLVNNLYDYNYHVAMLAHVTCAVDLCLLFFRIRKIREIRKIRDVFYRCLTTP